MKCAKASGYYKMHMDVTGKPRTDLLYRIATGNRNLACPEGRTSDEDRSCSESHGMTYMNNPAQEKRGAA